jgi:hypothetical protein
MSDQRNFDPAAEKALSWYGWGSPVGLGIFVLAVSLSAVVIHYAWIMR